MILTWLAPCPIPISSTHPSIGEPVILRASPYRRQQAISSTRRHICKSASYLLVVALLVACGLAVSIPSELVEPEVVGEIDEASFVKGTTATLDVQLHDGHSVRVNLNEAEDLYGRAPEAGLLLLYGTRDGDAWYVTLGASLTEGCFRLPDPARDSGQFIDFPIGIRLSKADSFDDEQVPRDGTYTSRKGFCVNRDGEIAQYGGR